MSTYIWCEDSGSGFYFWQEIFQFIKPDYIIETKGNNSAIRKAIDKTDDKNLYYILVDNVVDNPDVLREVKRIKSSIQGKNNIRIINIHSFEFILLSFSLIENWVFAEKDELKEKRMPLLHAKDILIKLIIDGGDSEDLAELKALLKNSDKKSTEQIAAKLLFDITRNTGFETDKSNLGLCFINNCCEYIDRQEDDICGLDSARLSSEEKKQKLITHSVLGNALREVGVL